MTICSSKHVCNDICRKHTCSRYNLNQNKLTLKDQIAAENILDAFFHRWWPVKHACSKPEFSMCIKHFKEAGSWKSHQVCIASVKWSMRFLIFRKIGILWCRFSAREHQVFSVPISSALDSESVHRVYYSSSQVLNHQTRVQPCSRCI